MRSVHPGKAPAKGVARWSSTALRGACVVPHAELTDQGRMYSPQTIKLKKLIGQGSFGEVFEGTMPNGNNGTAQIVLKRVKSKVAGAERMAENEHLLNVHVHKNAADSCASFLGYSVVETSAQVPDKRLTPGKWLIWRYQGVKTLGDYMRRRDCLTALAEDLGVSEEAAIPTVLQHILESIAKLHAAGLVHRDVKPSNIILCEEDRRFRLIDLGAMADLRTGTNYTPDESILDPFYCPPEQYVLPTDAPDLASKSRVMSLAMSAMLWSKHKPDRFDMYSLGLIFLQLAMPHLRNKTALQGFHSSFKRCRYDLSRWRTISTLRANHTAVLDANDGAGWELAEALLRPRKVQVLNDGHVYFTNEGQQRPSAEQALEYRFIAQAVAASESEEREAPSTAQGSNKGMFGMFKDVQKRFFKIEADLLSTAQQAEEATTTVQKLRKAVEEGKADERELERAEGLLTRLVGSMTYLQAELDATVAGANRAFRSGMVGTRTVDKEIALASMSSDSEAEDTVSTANINTSTSTPSALQSRDDARAPPDDADSGGRKGWGLANVFLGSIKSMGKAVKITSSVVEVVNSEAAHVMQDYNKRQYSRLNETERQYMELLREKRVKPSSQWEQVQTEIASDPRFQAVVGERKLTLYKLYIEGLQRNANLRLEPAEEEFAKQLTMRVISSDALTWEAAKAIWAKEPFFRDVNVNAAETLFVRHVAKLQKAEAAIAQAEAAEIEFRAMLMNIVPPVTADTDWSDVVSQYGNDPRFSAVPPGRRGHIFRQMQASMAPMTTVTNGNVSAARVASARAAKEPTEDDLAVLEALRKEQARLKQEYERMDQKLRAMESRIGGKPPGSEPVESSLNGASRAR